MESIRVRPPKSWSTVDHWLHVLSDPYYVSLVEIQDCIHHSVHEFFSGSGLKVLDLPLTTGSISSPMGLGSDSKPVRIDLFGQPTYLADSMQFMLELACRLHPAGAGYKSISFRGEDADASHLCQFQHAECEIAGGLEDIMDFGGRFVHHLTVRLLESCAAAVAELAGTTGHLEDLVAREGRYPRLTMAEAVRVARTLGPNLVFDHPCGFSQLTRAGEARINELFGDGLAVWVTHFPALAVPFYQAFDPGDPTRTLNADLVLGGCEAIGCGQRHLHAADLVKALRDHMVYEEPYRWYIQMRERHPLQTSGVGLGVERYMMWALKQSDIRDCVLFYRENGLACVP